MKIDLEGSTPKPIKRRFPIHGQGEAKAEANKPIKGMYATKPAVPSNKVAGAPLTIPDYDVGIPKMVPHQMGSLNGPAENFVRHPQKGAILGAGAKAPSAPHGFGHSATQRVGKMRISGHPTAHRIGKK